MRQSENIREGFDTVTAENDRAFHNRLENAVNFTALKHISYFEGIWVLKKLPKQKLHTRFNSLRRADVGIHYMDENVDTTEL
jgi:hypothetical protein